VGDGVGGSPCLLTEEQLIALDIHLQANLYLSAKAIAHWVEETFGVSYTECGMTAVLHRLPGKADREAQERFLEAYDEIEKTRARFSSPVCTKPESH